MGYDQSYIWKDLPFGDETELKKKKKNIVRLIIFLIQSASWATFWRIKIWSWGSPKGSLGPITNCGLSWAINNLKPGMTPKLD